MKIFAAAFLASLVTVPAHAPGVPAPTDAATYIGQLPNLQPRLYVQQRASREAGWEGPQWRCLTLLIHEESRWSPTADNQKSTAYGLFQQLRVSPTATVTEQVTLGIRYIKHRYGTPCDAWEHHKQHNWY